MATDRPVTPETGPLLLDTMLGKLAVYLRMCGYDTAYAGDCGVEADDAVRKLAREEGRRLLTRDAELAASIENAVLLVEREPNDQLDELRAAGFELRLPETPTRCGRCNGRLEPAPLGADRPVYAPPPDEFDCWRCVDCGQWFWRGSHWDRVAELL